MTGAPANPYVFVVGCPRSGTTLLQRMLDAHPDLAVANDTHFVPRVLDGNGAAGDRPLTPALVERARRDRRFDRLGLDDASVDAAAAAAATYAEFVAGLYDALARTRGKTFGGEKTPDYVRHLPLLAALFPRARFVHIVRDGRDVALSMLDWAPKRGKGPAKLALWPEEPVGVSALWWRWQVRAGLDGGRPLGPSRYLEVRYEDLVRDAEACTRRVAAFLGLPFAPEMVRFHEGRAPVGRGSSAKKRWLPPTAGIRDWRSQMARRDVELFEALAGDLLDELGYERAASGVSAPVAEAAQRCAVWWAGERARRDARPAGAAEGGLVAELGRAGYRVVEGGFGTGRPDRQAVRAVAPGGREAVAKPYASDEGAAVFAGMQALWRSSFGARREPPGLPEPLACLAGGRVVIMEDVGGRPLAETGVDAAGVSRCMALLGDLHASDAEPSRVRSPHRVVRSLERKAADVAAQRPDLARAFAATVEAVAAAQPADGELVPSHGDFSPRNVVDTGNRLVLIDWDRFCRADPARDVAYFGAWGWASAARRGAPATWDTLDAAVDAYQRARPAVDVASRLGFYVAAGLVRTAHGIVVLWPAEAAAVPAILDEARRWVT